MGAGVLPWGQEGAVRAQRRGCGRGLHRSRGPAAPGPEGTKPAPLPFLALICRWHLPLAELSCHPEARKPVAMSLLGQRNRVGDGGWLDLGQVDRGQHCCRGPSCARPPQVLQAQRTPGLGLRKLESVDRGVPGLASPSPRWPLPAPGACVDRLGRQPWDGLQWKLTF